MVEQETQTELETISSEAQTDIKEFKSQGVQLEKPQVQSIQIQAKPYDTAN